MQENVQFQSRSSRLFHGDGIIGPSVGAGDAVDAADDRHAGFASGGDDLQVAQEIFVAEIAFEVFAGIAHARVGRQMREGRGLSDDLFLEDGFDMFRVGRIGRAGDDDRRAEFQSEIGSFHGR